MSCPLPSPRLEPETSYPTSSTRIPDVSGARFLPEASFRVHRQDWLSFAADDRSQRPMGGGGGSAHFSGGGGGGGGWQGGGGGGGGGGKDLSTVTCFKCNQTGHFANNCNNAAVPGQRGGMER